MYWLKKENLYVMLSAVHGVPNFQKVDGIVYTLGYKYTRWSVYSFVLFFATRLDVWCRFSWLVPLPLHTTYKYYYLTYSLPSRILAYKYEKQKSFFLVYFLYKAAYYLQRADFLYPQEMNLGPPLATEKV